MNALEKYRKDHGRTYESIAKEVGMTKPSVWRHCAGETISGEAAILYHARLGIPLEDLRPDLYPAQGQGQHGEAA